MSGESKSRLVKAAGAESCGQRSNQNLYAAVARSTFSSENAQKLTVSEDFFKFRCRKIALRCGERHMCKSKCTKSCVLAHILKFRCRRISQLASSSVNQSVR